ncbi:MAG TPA: alkylmercury lyase family protein [Gaiellaceae bacterium]|nr:alkylmercury lyase family protein [Gaiellaceae bacterium]
MSACADVPIETARSRRVAALSAPERRLYAWVVEQFARRGRPGRDELAAAAAALGVDLARALATLARLDLLHRGGDGEIAVAYPFSGQATAHRVSIDGADEVFAMCAIDALGIAPMLGLPTEVVSSDPVSGGEVWVRIDPGDGAWWEPETAVVLDGRTCAGGPSFRSCCETIRFFESGENAVAYRLAHPQVRGEALALPQAIEAARLIFGDLLREARAG